MDYDVSQGKAILFGGTGTKGREDDTWAYDPTGAQGNWLLRLEPGPSRRTGHVMAYDPSVDRSIVYGGDTGGGYIDEFVQDTLHGEFRGEHDPGVDQRAQAIFRHGPIMSPRGRNSRRTTRK